MARTNIAPPETTRTDVQIGLVLADQRTGERRRVLYADSRVVLLRDESNSTTLLDRTSFEAELGTRYRPKRNTDAPIDAGQYDALRDTLAAYEREEGRKARHKADALREALDLFPGHAVPEAAPPDRATADVSDDDVSDDDVTGDDDVTDDVTGDDHGDDATEVPLEEIPGIGPETAGKLRVQGFVTEADLRGASDEAILAVSGVGPSNLANIREYLA